MKVICISNKGWERLPITIGKIYDVISEINIPVQQMAPEHLYFIMCDNGLQMSIRSEKFRFLTIEEKRDLKLDDLIE
jgi:hypothetical protein